MRKTFLFTAALLFALPAIAAEITVPGTPVTLDVVERAEMDAALQAQRLSMQGHVDALRIVLEGADEDARQYILDLTGRGVARDAAILELRLKLEALAAGGGSPDPDPPIVDPPIPDSPFDSVAYNSWQAFGPSISSIWKEVDPPLDPLTRGNSGLAATVNQFCGAGWDAKRKSLVRACGGHNSTGYGRAWRYSYFDLDVAWASPDVRLDDSRLPKTDAKGNPNKCPYPSEMGDWAGPAANHFYDGIVTLPDGSTLFWPKTQYTCKLNLNREAVRVWKLSPDGAWSASAKNIYPWGVKGMATALLPDGKVLSLSSNFAGVFDPDTMSYVPFSVGSKRYEGHSKYLEFGGFANLTEAGEVEPGKLRFFMGDVDKKLFKIHVIKAANGEWSLGWPKRVKGVDAAWYTAGVTWLPDQQALMYWYGHPSASFILFDKETPEVRLIDYPEIPDRGQRNFFIHDGGLQYDADAGVVVALGPASNEGVWVFRPPLDIRAASAPAPPPRADLQGKIDAAPANSVVVLDNPNGYLGATIGTSGLTLRCAPGVTVGGGFEYAKGQGLLLVQKAPFTIEGCVLVGGNKAKETAGINFATSGDLFVRDTKISDFANGILTSSYRHDRDTNVTVSGSTFVNNGYKHEPGPTHQIYYGNGGGTSDGQPPRLTPDGPGWSTAFMHGGTLDISDSTFVGQTDGGHGIKSGAQNLKLTRVKIETGLAGFAYRSIDAYAGGSVEIKDVEIIHKYANDGSASDNPDPISFAPEVWGRNFRGHARETDRIVIDNLTATCEGLSAQSKFIKYWRAVNVEWVGANDNDPDGTSTITNCGQLSAANK